MSLIKHKDKKMMVYAYSGILLRNKKKLLIPTETWMDFKGIMQTVKEIRVRILQSLSFSLYDLFENTNL